MACCHAQPVTSLLTYNVVLTVAANIGPSTVLMGADAVVDSAAGSSQAPG